MVSRAVFGWTDVSRSGEAVSSSEPLRGVSSSIRWSCSELSQGRSLVLGFGFERTLNGGVAPLELREDGEE